MMMVMNRWSLFLRKHLMGMMYGLIMLAILTSVAQLHQFADLSVHFMTHYALCALMLCVLFLLVRAPQRNIIVAALLTVLFTGRSAVLLLPREVVKNEVYEDVTILQYNVRYDNVRGAELAEWIVAQRPDVVVLQEVTPAILSQLKLVDLTYPYRFFAPEEHPFGMVFFSRLPLVQAQRTKTPDGWNHYTQLELQSLKHHIPIDMMELHTIPPMGSERTKERNEHMLHVAQMMADLPPSHAKIMVGDMNITPYSPWFADVEQRSTLNNIMRGVSIEGTWPSFLPSWMRIPIDHMLVSDQIEVLERRVEQDLGSDHMPVIIRLRVYRHAG
jgi:endonuclease/exonuclease/phosphatase (EEP) superfamily protein YafD